MIQGLGPWMVRRVYVDMEISANAIARNMILTDLWASTVMHCYRSMANYFSGQGWAVTLSWDQDHGWRTIFTAHQRSCKPCTSYDRDVCLSVRPSVTRWHCVKTTQARITKSSPTDSQRTLVFQIKNSSRNSRGVTPFRLVPKSTTLDDLEWPICSPLYKRCIFRSPPQKFEWR